MTKKQQFTEGEVHTIEDLIAIVQALMDPVDGCSWDKVQTHESLKKCLVDECLVDECEEVLDAIDHKDDKNLCEELGDVLLQVVMHARIAQQQGAFDFDDVVQGISDKMIRRHPHIFSGAKAPETKEQARLMWEEIKRKEKESD
ncbi:MAG: nucleotide pyrophosphohydrolase [Lachnospiraceae bacterium]|nr:nucleotide pyrophosphohydrolase [Lachnospiraceae bacterium]